MFRKIVGKIRPGHQSRPDPPSDSNQQPSTKKQSHKFQYQVDHDDGSPTPHDRNVTDQRRHYPPLKIPAYRKNVMRGGSYRINGDSGSIHSAPAFLQTPQECLSVQSDPMFGRRRSSNGSSRRNVNISDSKNSLKTNKQSSGKQFQSRYAEEATTTTLSSYERIKRPKSLTEVPEGEVTIVLTDVQGSTSMWEANHVAMKEAVDLHDTIVRKCYSKLNGYEITTEGDAFQLAFKHPLDAFKFAIRCQIDLYKAAWSPEILALNDGADLGNDSFRGFRVRIGIHHGPTLSKTHNITGRVYYEGATVGITKAVERLCHGGQILTTMDTWRAVSGMAERQLGSPQILDCGEHLLLQTKKKGSNITNISKQIIQIVPKKFAFDYFTERGRRPNNLTIEKKSMKGRKFPPLKTKGQLSASFFDAPYSNGKVAIVFMHTMNRDDENLSDRVKEKNSVTLAKIVRSLLARKENPGYECQEDNGRWMLAFHKIVDAVLFGLNLQKRLESAPIHVKVGIHCGPYTSMGPHAVTGRADYFGPIVNRAARVTSATPIDHVCVGMTVESGEVIVPPDFGSLIRLKFVGKERLKGVAIDIALFACSQ